uniref:adenine phosphoribosyltransferase n=1 Tax=Meleagris gallopavo TaxID=9103 RepID=G1N2G1_MELGA
ASSPPRPLPALGRSPFAIRTRRPSRGAALGRAGWYPSGDVCGLEKSLLPSPGAAAAATLHKGFLAIRKAGHLCVETLAEPYTDYSGREKVMEVRTDTVTPGMRILLVDQWVETGGTMRAAIQLVERQGGSWQVGQGCHIIDIKDDDDGCWGDEVSYGDGGGRRGRGDGWWGYGEGGGSPCAPR